MLSLSLNGLRISEALGADIDRLGFERGHRTLVVHRKGGKTVTIPLAPRTARALDLGIGERLGGPIFLGSSGERMTRDAAARIVRRVAKTAGIAKRIGLHSLRHSFITAALDAGVPLRDVQEAASHADPRTTTPRPSLTSANAGEPAAEPALGAAVVCQQKDLARGVAAGTFSVRNPRAPGTHRLRSGYQPRDVSR